MERTNQARVSQPTNDLKYKYYQILLFWDSITKIKINLFIFDKPSIDIEEKFALNYYRLILVVNLCVFSTPKIYSVY